MCPSGVTCLTTPLFQWTTTIQIQQLNEGLIQSRHYFIEMELVLAMIYRWLKTCSLETATRSLWNHRRTKLGRNVHRIYIIIMFKFWKLVLFYVKLHFSGKNIKHLNNKNTPIVGSLGFLYGNGYGYHPHLYSVAT